MSSYMRFTVLAISADEPWLIRQTADIYPWFTEFEINHGFHPDQYPDQSCRSLQCKWVLRGIFGAEILWRTFSMCLINTVH